MITQHFLTLIEYGTIELHPLVIQNSWLLSSKELSVAFQVPLSKIIESLDVLTEEKHYSYESIEYSKNKSTSSILFFSKAGIIRLAYFLKNDNALNFLEFIENIDLKEEKDKDTIHSFYNEIEELLKERLDKLKNNPDTSLEEINHFILTLDNLIKKRKGINTEKSNQTNISDILQTVINLAQSYSKPKL